jgi:hypothetical protein
MACLQAERVAAALAETPGRGDGELGRLVLLVADLAPIIDRKRPRLREIGEDGQRVFGE